MKEKRRDTMKNREKMKEKMKRYDDEEERR